MAADLISARYSGPASRAFWRRIAKLPEPDRSIMYAAGVLLHNHEQTVLTWIRNAEVTTRAARARKRKVKR